MKPYIILLISLLLAGLAVNAQSPADFEQYQQLFKLDDAVFISHDCSVEITMQKGLLNIFENDFEDLMLLGNNVNKYSESTVDYSSLVDLIDLEASTLIPEKNKYRTEHAKNVVTEKSLSGSVFYDDYKSKKIYFTGLKPGARRIVSSKKQVLMPELLSPFFFQTYAPCAKSTYEISVPSSVEIEYVLFNVKEGQVHFSMEQKKDVKIYKWEYDNVPGLTFIDDDAPGVRYFIPHIVVRVKDYQAAGKTVKVLGTKQDLYNWYYGFIRNVNYNESATLKNEVDSLTKNSSTDVDKAKQILYWVQDHIRYVAFEDSLGGFIPRQPDSVCNKRYGDCKDMATILVAMLRQAGLVAYPVWIGTRDLPYTHEQIPSPLIANHMITALKLKDDFYFLDATSKYLAYGYPSAFIQGKEALIGIDKENFKIITVPEVEPVRNKTVDSFKLTIDQRLLRGTDVRRMTGYYRQDYSYFLGRLGQNNFRQAMEATLAVGNNKFFLDTFQIINREDRDRDLVVNSRFHIGDYLQQSGDEIYVNLNLDRIYYNDVIDTSLRKFDREESYKSVVQQHYELEIPAGYQVEYLPPSKSFNDDLFSFNFSYHQSGNKVMLDNIITTNFLLLKKENFSRWNTMIHELNKVYNEALILKKKL